jgi:Asp-tRNA(Asn)/Glu-tRNA(Gln) amidotransferase A subunit family amidase
MLKTTDTLDSVGLFANNVDDCRLLFDVMRVKGLDYPNVNNNLENEGYQKKNSSKWKIGIVLEQHSSVKGFSQYALSAFSSFINDLKNNTDYHIGYPSFPGAFNNAHDIQEKIYHKALSYYFKKEFENHTLISPVMYDIVNDGKKISVEDYQASIIRQNELGLEIDKLFDEYDVLLTLSTAGHAPEFGTAIDPQDTCLIWTMCGLPVINVPLFNQDQMPFGLQVIGRKYQDYKLLNFVNELVSN